MLKQYVFFYFMVKDFAKVENIIPKHIEYWEEISPVKYTGGPFADQSGGMILFEAETMEFAENQAMNDPFVTEKVLEKWWIKEWMRKR